MCKISLFLCLFTIAACSTLARSQDASRQSDPISVDQLKRALSMAEADNADKITKQNIRDYIIKKWLDDRTIAAAEYEDNLKRAIDSWYTNDRDWRKIPAEIWAKLRDADKGRLKLSIDPELTYLVPPSPKTLSQTSKTKK
ncbi:MAG: hypothetical protein P4K93_09770 [Terracidiphilus sp.]|nr:hypothetical protein [Terracidiphilus sp.]